MTKYPFWHSVTDSSFYSTFKIHTFNLYEVEDNHCLISTSKITLLAAVKNGLSSVLIFLLLTLGDSVVKVDVFGTIALILQLLLDKIEHGPLCPLLQFLQFLFL